MFDLTFTLFNVASGAGQVGTPVSLPLTPVTNGLFTVTLDFGNQFPGAGRWLEIAVRTNGGGAFTTLTPRQRLTATPYAITASNITGLLPAASLAGTYSSVVTLNNAGNSFTGSGAGLTSLNANNLASGTVPDARLATSVARTNQVWQLAGNLGTTAGTDFLGTRDNQALELKVNNTRALRLEPNAAGAPNVIGGTPVNYVSNSIVGATIAGGGATDYLSVAYTNRVIADFGTVGGGVNNMVSGVAAVVGGGAFNTVGAYAATVGGGQLNNSGGSYATIGGGERNLSGGLYTTIGGGSSNTNLDDAATIGGGVFNRSSAESTTIGGGHRNFISANFATIGGGSYNTNRGDSATVAGGSYNTSSNLYTTVGGGLLNASLAEYATVAGGGGNSSSGEGATVGGGGQNIAAGFSATVPGGLNNRADGNFSFAAGSGARANHAGSFAWADSAGEFFNTSANNQFLIRAGGGVGLGATNLTGALFIRHP